MKANGFFSELRRRNVHKVAASYLVVAWLIVQGVSLMLYGHEERPAAVIALVVIVTIGFFIALYISWAFEATPQGMKRTENVQSDTVLPTWSRRKYATFIIGTALLAASMLAVDLYRTRSKPIQSTATRTNF
jgi:hypothetical protein